jgi:hypothetical protein
VAPLHRAIALTQVDAVAMRIGKHLHLHMARRQQRALQQQLAGAEGRQASLRALARRRQLRHVGHQAHAAAAATGRGLDHQGQADALRLGHKSRIVWSSPW